MGRCRDCKHWRWIQNENMPARPYFADAHDARTFVWPGPYGECEIVHDTSYHVDFDSQPAWIYGMYYLPDLSLMTKPEFGCILFEEKD